MNSHVFVYSLVYNSGNIISKVIELFDEFIDCFCLFLFLAIAIVLILASSYFSNNL